MANTQPLIDLVSHIIRVYTTANGCIELAAYSKDEAFFIAEALFRKSALVYKVHVYQFSPEKRILHLE